MHVYRNNFFTANIHYIQHQPFFITFIVVQVLSGPKILRMFQNSRRRLFARARKVFVELLQILHAIRLTKMLFKARVAHKAGIAMLVHLNLKNLLLAHSITFHWEI